MSEPEGPVDSGIRYCPGCGQPDRCDWRTYGEALRQQWITPDEGWYCQHCGRSFDIAIWSLQRESPTPAQMAGVALREAAATPQPQEQPEKGEDRSMLSILPGFCAVVVIFLGLIATGYLFGVSAQDSGVPLPGVNRPVYTKPFSFDRLAEIDRCVTELEEELAKAKDTQNWWKSKARDLIGQPQGKVEIEGWENPGRIRIEGVDEVAVTNCTFLMGADEGPAIDVGDRRKR